MGGAGRLIVVEMVAHHGQDSQAGPDRQGRAKMSAVRAESLDAVRALARST